MRPGGVVEPLFELDYGIEQGAIRKCRRLDRAFRQFVQVVVVARISGWNCSRPMGLLMKDGGLLPESALGVDGNNRAVRFGKRLRKGGGRIGLNRPSMGWNPGRKRSSLTSGRMYEAVNAAGYRTFTVCGSVSSMLAAMPGTSVKSRFS